MPYRFIVLPFNEETEDFETDAFHRLEERYDIRQCRTHFFQTASGRTYWTAFVDLQRKTSQADDTGIDLDDLQKKRYEALRDWRNTYAESEGLPPYLIATNKQLKQMTTLDPPSLEGLASIRGIGSAKVEKYGKLILPILLEKTAENEAK